MAGKGIVGVGLWWRNAKVGLVFVASLAVLITVASERATFPNFAVFTPATLDGAEFKKGSHIVSLGYFAALPLVASGYTLACVWKHSLRLLPTDSELRVSTVIIGGLQAAMNAGIVESEDLATSIALSITLDIATTALHVLDFRSLWFGTDILTSTGTRRPELLIVCYVAYAIVLTIMMFVHGWPSRVIASDGNSSWSDPIGYVFLTLFVPMACGILLMMNEIRIYFVRAIRVQVAGKSRRLKSTTLAPSTVGIAALAPIIFVLQLVILVALGFVLLSSSFDESTLGMSDNFQQYGGYMMFPILTFAIGVATQFSIADLRSKEKPEDEVVPIEKEAGRLQKAALFLQSWLGQQVIALINYIVPAVCFSYLLNSDASMNGDASHSALLGSSSSYQAYSLLVVVSCVGIVVTCVTILGRFRPRLKIAPTDDSMRLTCLLTATMLVGEGLSLMTNFDRPMNFESAFTLVLYLCCVVFLAFVTMPDIRGVMKNEEIIKVRRPRLMLIASRCCFFWTQISYIVLAVIVCSYEAEVEFIRVALLFLVHAGLMSYINNEVAMYIEGRKKFHIIDQLYKQAKKRNRANLYMDGLCEIPAPTGICAMSLIVVAVAISNLAFLAAYPKAPSIALFVLEIVGLVGFVVLHYSLVDGRLRRKSDMRVKAVEMAQTETMSVSIVI